MTTTESSLCEEILAEAHREAEQILRSAQDEAAVLGKEATEQAAAARQQHLDQARKEANRQRELLLATVPLEIGRRRTARIEILLNGIRQRARDRLLAREGFDYEETLARLAAEAISQMAGNDFVIKLSPEDRAIAGDHLSENIAGHLGHSARVSITVAEAPGLAEGGLLIEDREGRQAWDNRLPARLERLWPELRRQIALRAGLVNRADAPGGSA